MARGGRFPTIFSPSGSVISHDAFIELRKQKPDPYIIREFENERVSLQLKNACSMMDARDIPKEFWQMYEVKIENILSTDIEGRSLPEPTRSVDPDSRKFVNLSGATDYYEKFLAKYTKSRFNETTGDLEEVGNLLAPPDPDKPTFSETSPMAGEFGSW